MPIVHHQVEINCSIDELFAYYVDVRNVARLAPPEMNLRILDAELPLEVGSRVMFSVRPVLVPFDVKWLFEVTAFEANRYFEETLIKGPFAHWVHRHQFETLGPNRSRVTDALEFEKPVPMLAAFVSDDYLVRKLREAFVFREAVLRRELER